MVVVVMTMMTVAMVIMSVIVLVMSFVTVAVVFMGVGAVIMSLMSVGLVAVLPVVVPLVVVPVAMLSCHNGILTPITKAAPHLGRGAAGLYHWPFVEP